MFDSLELQAKLPRARVCAGPRLAKAIALAALVAAVFAGAAAAQAHGLRPGVRTAAPSGRALSQSLAQTTGLTPSQVTAQNICGATRPGYARCAGQALVLRSSHARVRPHVRRQATFGRVSPAFVPGFASPAVGSGSSPPQPGTPAYLQQAYDLSYLSQTGGVGDTIAIVDPYHDPNAASDLAVYRSAYGLPACTTSNGCFRQVNQRGQASSPPAPSSSWEQEESLDLDAVSALCPNCHILLVEADSGFSTDLSVAAQTAATLGAKQISYSWTISSHGILPGPFVFDNVSSVAATGDAGYLGNGADNFPAAFSKVTAAGGTSLAPGGTGNARGFSEAAWSGGGSGCDPNVTKPAYQTDTGCAHQTSGGGTSGRAYSDLSADADPATGLSYYDTGQGGWGVIGGTSLTSPLIAAYYAITGASAGTPQWAYNNSALLNDPASGSTGACEPGIHYICNAGIGYDGPTGVGSISGAVVTGAPGIGGPPISSGSSTTYTKSTRSHGATLTGGIYPNGLDTRWWLQYGIDNSYGGQTPPVDIGSGTSPISVTGYLSHLNPSTKYHYRLVAQNSLGTTYGYDYSFTTPPSSPSDPTAAFTSLGAVTPGSSLAFDASGSGNSILNYSWDFGDGTPVQNGGPSASASHPYTSPGVYSVTLIVTNSSGLSDSTSHTVTVDTVPTASFTGSPDPSSLAVAFDAGGSGDSVGTIADYSWDFGDGATGSGATATHPYSSRGPHHVTLTVTNDAGQTNTSEQDVTADTAPTVAFIAPTGGQTPGSALNFDANASTAMAGGSITTYSWDFGDGATGSGVSPSHNYTRPGHYTVALTVTDDLGVKNTITHIVTVDAPVASFSASPNPATTAPAVAFDGHNSSDALGRITSYSWEFGDGATGSGSTASHAYRDPGRYTVTLTVMNDVGQTASVSHSLTVDAPPRPLFSVSPTAARTGAAVTFNASSSSDDVGTITAYSWNFGDGATSGGASTSHVYASPGTYEVALTVTNDAGQSTTSSHTVAVYAAPSALFSVAPATTLPRTAVSFNAGSSSDAGGTITGYNWNFGDGGTASGPSPSHAYAGPGAYTVTLTVTGSLGLATSSSHTVTVNPPPLSAQLSSAKRQKLGAVLKHGLSLTVSTNAVAKASFVVTMPVHATRRGRKHAKHGSRSTTSILLRTSARSFAPGSHGVTLKLSRAAAGKLRAGTGAVLTVQMTLTDVYGRRLGRSARVTINS